MLSQDRIRPLLVSAALAILIAAGGIPTKVMAAPIGLMERFALAQDRESILAELIPGTEDYFFYHCLHYQNTRQLAKAESTLTAWINANRGSMNALTHAMKDRQRLLTYDQSPQKTIDYFVERLGIELHHSPAVAKGTRRYASNLADTFINLENLVQSSLRDNVKLTPAGMQIAADQYLKNQNSKTKLSIKDFLKRVDGPYLKGLDQLVIKELQTRRDRDQRFGDLPAHQFLTREELDAVAQAVPAVTDDKPFVNATMRMLRPSAEVDLSQQPDALRDYLGKLNDYVQTLPPSYNSLKASAAYRLLESNLKAGVWDLPLFLRYLQLPRQSGLVHRSLASRSYKANLNEDFSGDALLTRIGNEQPVVEAHLEHFLVDAKDTRQFKQLIEDDYLRKVFARTKLLSGVRDPEPYYEMLTAPERQELRDRIQLSFAPNNPRVFATDQPTVLLTDVKNVDKLVVRVYEMNSLAFYRANDQLLDSDVDLDGLIATHERTIEYDRPSITRHRETIAIPEISGRGVWIVDLVGKGLRARSIIRRGDLQTVQSSDANGMHITVLDENRNRVGGAKIIAGNQEFTADDQGKILLPMVSESTNRKAILTDGKIAQRMKFRQLKESYSLDAGFFVDRTLLQSGGVSQVIVRPRLALNDVTIDPATLKQVSLRIVATDLDGIETTKQYHQLELDQLQELVLPFRVPSRLASVKFQLSGQVTGLSDRRNQELLASHEIQVSGVRRTTHTVDAFLTRDGDDYVIETRGRSGEIVPASTVNVQFQTVIGEIRPSCNLQSDDRGRITLGPLQHVESVQYGVAGANKHRFHLDVDQQQWPSEIHLASDTPLRLPLIDGNSADQFRLLELRHGQPRDELSDRLKLNAGFLVADSLPSGDYHLIHRETGHSTAVSVIDGPEMDRVLVGKIRHHDKSIEPAISIRDVDFRDDGSLRVQLTGQTDMARIHIIGTRFFDDQSPADQLAVSSQPLRQRRLSLARSGYVSDLRLGEEYEYVLRRQYAHQYLGVMLPQPSVILNPWETETTSNDSQAAKKGQAPVASAPQPSSEMMRRQAARTRSTGDAGSEPEFDFLSDSGVTLTNLVADENGQLLIPADALEGLPLIQVVVASPTSLLRRTVATNLGDPDTEDLRLGTALDATQRLTFERAVSVVTSQQPLDLETLGSAQIQVYGNVGSLLTLYRTLIGDDRLDEFQILGRWHQLSNEQKLESYSELASHELHLFLKMHDPDFFSSVIKPYLINKKDKQFVDHWLLGNDLSQYTTLWRYQKLSAAEKALLAIRMPQLRSSIRRDLTEQVSLLADDHQQTRVRVESALRSSGAVWMDDMVVAEAEMDVMMMQSVDGFAGGGGMGGATSGPISGGAEAFGANISGNFAAPQSSVKSRKMSRMQSMRELRASGSARSSRSFFMGRDASALGEQFGFYQGLDATKQWAESHWDRQRVVGGPSSANLIPVNLFWNDLASNEPTDDNVFLPVVSKHLLSPSGNRHQALVALALCGLPLEQGEVSLPVKPETIYKPAHPVALVTKRLKILKSAQGDSSVLIGQLFRRSNADVRKGETPEDPGQFEVGISYQGQVVVSNPTPTEQVVELFWQIPAGSIPLGGSQTTDSKTVTLQPFAVQSVDYQFYFPSAGEFQHYPATVAADDSLLAQGKPKTFRVLETVKDESVTWQSIARDGDVNAIKSFLNDANLHELDWKHVLPRLRDRAVYDVVVGFIQSARLPETNVLGYGFEHKDMDAIRQLFSLRQDVISRCGPWLESELLEIDSQEQLQYEHLEYAPLVRARIHRLGKEDEILNPTFLSQYQQFVRRLGFQATIGEADKMPLTYYLLLQNRIAEAIDCFASLDPDSIPSQLQYDYLDGYLALHQGDFEAALSISQSHADHPVPRWRSRFATMGNHVRQRFDLMDVGQLVSTDDGQSKVSQTNGISSGAADLALADRERANSQASATAPEVIIRVEDDFIRIDHRNTDQVDINLYGVDLELLFSKAPFARKDLQRIAMVRPTRTETLTMKTKTGTTRYRIPESMRSNTLLVESSAGASRSTTLFYGGELTTYVSEAFGQLQTTDSRTHQPESGAYVKVYGRYPGGQIRFFKDGYTDGRGRFDYTSISAAEAKGAERFAILVLSKEKGASLHDVAAP